MSTRLSLSAQAALSCISIRHFVTQCLRRVDASARLAMPGRVGFTAARILAIAIATACALPVHHAEAGVMSMPPSLSLNVGVPGDMLTIPVSLRKH